ncbi:SPOR domain-containing protein [Oculatella sp. FACHB-28]|uniref:SPOR domain-containing protein n=1 Tax=Oculatella sp. FACHB-28 TaxID=2692845 RepID=UPI001683F4B8|nr:SPOR domain-containing protein [Oculatella sp. FACHB-28]MBD2057319.1 SPOR domain-containing protein [Oculatella sp. FACHB-28]
MRQRSSQESSTSLPSKPLHAVLQTALGGLDMQLEEELSRYRRSRKSKPTKPKSRRSRSRDAKPMDTIYVEAKGGRTQAAAAGAIALSTAKGRPSPVPPPPPSQIKRSVASPTPPSLTPPSTPNQLAIAAAAATVPNAEPSGLVSPGAEAETTQKLVNPDDINLGPDDYLESSEELLKSLDDQEEVPPQEPSFIQSLLTPLGIGSMLLLLLSSVTLGYMIMNPASLGIFSEGEPRGDRNSELSGEVATNPDSTDLPSNALPGSPDLASEEFRELNLSTLSTLPTGEAPAPVSVTPGAVPSPTASTPAQTAPLPNPQSAPTLPRTVVPATVSMRPNGRSAPSQASAPARSNPAARPSAPAPARPNPAARASAPAPARPNPVARASAPAPARPSSAARPSAPAQANTATPSVPQVQAQPASPPVATAPAPASPPAASQDDYYYVTTPYNGDRSLEQARQAVGDAYVRNTPEGGAQVQVGAFRDRAGAEDLASELEQQGISAEVHQP